MTQDAGTPADGRDPEGRWDPEVLDLAHRMFELARDGEADQLRDALDQGLPPNLTNDKGDTLLILASYHAHAVAVDVLLAAGADPLRANDRGQTALAAAVFRQSEPIVRALMAAGADPHGGGPTALETAQFFDLPQMAALLSS